MDEYIEVNEGTAGKPEYRLNRVQMERRGRGRSIATTFMVFVALLVLQFPLNRVANDAWEVAFVASRTVDLPIAAVAGRLSLLVDLAMIVAYLTLTWRALELMRAWERRPPMRRAAHVAAAAVVVGAVMDLAENVALWIQTGAPDWQDDLSVPWTDWMRGIVFVGLSVVVLLALDSWLRWGNKSRADTGDDAEAEEGAEGAEGAEKDRPDRIICCSGGGVRSAAFCLGGLQELTDRGIYADTDHVIGVSGGGYIAAAYHTARWHSGAKGDDVEWEDMTPPAFAPGTPEVQRLRRNSSYLLDSGNSALQGLLSLLFGIAVNLVLLTAVLGATAWLLAWYLVASGGLSGWHTATAASLDFTFGPWQRALWVWVVPAFGVALFVLEKGVEKYRTIPFEKRMPIRRLSGPLITYGTLLTVLLLGVPTVLEWMHNFAASSGSAVANLLHALGFVPNDVCVEQLKQGTAKEPVTACGVTSTMPLTTGVATGELGGRASAPWVSVGGATAVLTAVLAVARSARGALGGEGTPGAGAGLGAQFAKVWSKVKDVVLPWAATVTIVVVLLVLLLRWTAGLVAAPRFLASWDHVLWFLVALLVLRLLTDVNRTSLHHFYRERLSFAFIVQRSRGAAGALPYTKSLRFSQSRPPSTRQGPRLVACAVANINDPGVVPVNRGCAPFVFDDTQIGLTDQQLPSGAALTPSALFEYAADRRFRDATIPAAMAMSGAAFSPLAGRQNKKLNPYRMVLALANARLGVWLPNPLWIDNLATVRRLVRTRNEEETLRVWPELSPSERNRLFNDYLNKPDQTWLWDLLPDPGTTNGEDPRCARPPEWQQPEPQAGGASLWLSSLRVRGYTFINCLVSEQSKPGPSRLLKEAVGRTSIYDRRLYITDGGHYDNLGLIEALRRRPKEIFVLDASADAEDTFRALGDAIATARMDLNCEVTFDPRSMRRLTEERSTAAWGNGHYRFDDGTEGIIRMVKVIMVEGLPWDVEAYSGSNPKFPRTGTGDQLYDEFDLEAYRVLGREVTRKLIVTRWPRAPFIIRWDPSDPAEH